eukprot:jgi/Psemu1/17421/gm1.17421_g
MRVKEDIIEPLQCTISSAKKRPPSAKTNLQFSPTPKQKKEEINVESDEESKESEEDLNRKPASKPKSKKHNNFSKDDITGYKRNESQSFTKHRFHNVDAGVEDLNRKPASKPKSKKHNNFSKHDITGYIRNESQNFTKHRFHNLEPGVAVMKLSNHSWKYDANFPDSLMSSKNSFQKIPNAIRCIHTLYRSMVPDAKEANKEEQPVEMITKIAETHADVVTAETGLDYFMTKFPNMKKLDIDLCGLITSQPGEGTFKHNPYNNAIAVFLLKGQVKRYHYVLVNAIQSLVLFMYHWDGKYFGRNVLEAALKKQYDEVIRLMEPYIVIHKKRLHIYFRFDDHVINNDIIKEINNFNFQLKYYTDGFRCNTEFFPQYKNGNKDFLDATITGPTKAKNPSGPKRNPDRFLGHNQTDLKGILIPEDANAKHYHELKDRLETLGGSKYIPQVGSSIEHLTRFERKDFAPTKPTVAKYSTTVTDPVTQTMQMVEVPGLKETLMDMYKEELKKKADEWIHYQRDMEKMYRLALGQIDDGMKAKLKGLKSWKSIDTSKCIVELLKAVRDLCFQSSRTKVHPVTNMLRAIRKLLCTQQRNLDAASYVKMMKENLDVVKSLGGTLICKATVTYEIETNPLYASYDYTTYLSLRGTTTRTAIDHTVEQRALAALIINGSDTDSSNLKQFSPTLCPSTEQLSTTVLRR